MSALRHWPLAHRRWLLLLAAITLTARILVPAGWMPVAGSHGVELGLCDGGDTTTRVTAPVMVPPTAMSMPMKSGVPMEHHHGAPDHPCSFAAAVAAFTTPDLVAPALPPSVHHRPLLVRTTVAIGRGLAAPPPPSTGPPAFA